MENGENGEGMVFWAVGKAGTTQQKQPLVWVSGTGI